MTPNTKNPDITVRGGLINVPNSAKPLGPARHRPNTPVNKKKVTVKPDHQVYTPDPPTQSDQPKTPATAPPEPPPTEPDGDPTHEPTQTSESD